MKKDNSAIDGTPYSLFVICMHKVKRLSVFFPLLLSFRLAIHVSGKKHQSYYKAKYKS